DPYLSFAKRVGAAPSSATKHTHEPLRDRYKTGLLAIQYGIQAETLGARLGVSAFDAHEMINQHHELFAVYWRWSDDWLAHALDTGMMWTPLGWTCRTGITEFNARSIRNFPIQGSGADILRVACIWATRHGLRLLGPVHDAVLIEAPFERIEADVALMQELMRRASRVVLGAHECPAATGRAQNTPDRWELEPMQDEHWSVRRLRELEAAAPIKRKKAEPFVKVPLWWIGRATKATNTGKALVCVELLYAAWKAKRSTFPLPNGRLAKLGLNRETKRRALYDLERAGLITVERPPRKTPIVTLVVS